MRSPQLPPSPFESSTSEGTGRGPVEEVLEEVPLETFPRQPRNCHLTHSDRLTCRSKGLKAQHVASIEWLVKATDAEVTGLSVGSHTLEFRPRLKPSQLTERRVRIEASSEAASTLLVLQAIFPFLIFAGTAGDEPVEVELSGGTNVSWSLSFEYLDQVLLPTLESRFGVRVERELRARGWSTGTLQRGLLWLRIRPLALGRTLQLTDAAKQSYGAGDLEVKAIDVSILAPAHMLETLQNALVRDLGILFPDVDVQIKTIEDSGKDSRIYALLVARSETLRWGRDILTSAPKKGKGRDKLTDNISKKVCKELYQEVETGGVVDEFLQDQLVIFQALADGETSFPRDNYGPAASLEKGMDNLTVDDRRRKDKTHEPFGQGSTHTTTARWVVSELLPKVAWYNKGALCEGVGMRMEPPT